jgi:hypothetical protein
MEMYAYVTSRILNLGISYAPTQIIHLVIFLLNRDTYFTGILCPLRVNSWI